jgi:hypothetical protein
VNGEAEMWFIGKLSRNKRGAGSIVGAVFIVLILLTGFTYYFLHVNVTEDYTKTLQDMQELDSRRNRESIEFTRVSKTSENKLNVTVKNTGSYQIHIIWLGVLNESATPETQDYYKLDVYVDPAETVTNISSSVTVSTGQLRIQLVTELGNNFSSSYPEEESGYNFVDEEGETPHTGTHSLFSAQQAGPDGIVDTLTEGSSSANQTANSDLDRNDWVSGQDSAGDVSAGVLGDTYSSDDSRYELVETKATAGGPAGSRNYLLAWRFDFTGLSGSRTDTHVYIEAQTTGETFRLYWSSDDSTMNYLGTVTSTSDSWRDWDIPDDTSTTIYILLKDNNDARADGTDTITADLIKIDALFLGIATTYELDLEVQWIAADYDEANEWLCIYGGTMGSEDIRVDVWDGTGWTTVFTDLSSGWNSVDVSSCLNSWTFKIRFRTSDDYSPHSWEIDATFLHIWS